MATNIREMAERHLSITLEGGFSLPVVFIGPDAIEDIYRCQVLLDSYKMNPDTGQMIVSDQPIVSARISSMRRVPLSGETWVLKIPSAPAETAEKLDFVLSATRAVEGGASIGFKRFYPRRAIQSC